LSLSGLSNVWPGAAHFTLLKLSKILSMSSANTAAGSGVLWGGGVQTPPPRNSED